MRKKTSYIPIILFMMLLILPTLAWGIVSLVPAAYETLNGDIGENRALATISEDATLGTITGELEDYYADRAPFRNVLITANQKLNSFIEKDYKDTILPFLLSAFYSDQGSTDKTLELYPVENNTTASVSVPVEIPESKPEPNYEEILRVEPTCTENGYVTYHSTISDDEYTDVLYATGHSEFLAGDVEASYTTYGHKIYVCSVCGNIRWTDFTPKLVDDSFFPVTIYNRLMLQGRNNWLFYVADDSIEYYRGTNILSENKMAEYLKNMQELKDICDAKGITLAYMVFPNKEQVYAEYMPTYASVAEKKRLDVFADYIADNSDITFIYPLTELKAGKMYYDTYYAYDTHWNKVGSYIGTMALYKALGKETTDLSTLSAVINNDVLETGFPVGNIDHAGYASDFEYILTYKPEVSVLYEEGERDIKYGYSDKIKTVTTGEDRRNFVMIGDSFIISMIPYVQQDFANTTFVKRETTDLAKEEIKNAEVLVISSVERFDTKLYDLIPTIISYLQEDR